MKNIFTDHPKTIGESYCEHFKIAFSFGFSMLMAGLACIIHAFLPFIFEKTGSNVLLKMTHQFVSRMPKIDERVLMISETVKEKLAKESKN